MTSSSKSVRIGESTFEDTLMKWYEEKESKVSNIDEVSECDIESEHDTNSEFDGPKHDESDDEVAKDLDSFVIFPFVMILELTYGRTYCLSRYNLQKTICIILVYLNQILSEIKMFSRAFLFVILAVTITCEAKKIKFVPSHPYIYNLELAFREDKISDYIVDSFLATAGSESDKLLHCEIGLTDLIKAIPIKKLGISDFTNAYKELNLSHNDDDLNNLISELNYAKLKEVGISVEKIYKSVAKIYFKDRPAELLEALRILGIAEEFSVAYTFGSEEDVFNALQNELLNVLGLKKLDGDVLANFINNQVASVLIERGLTKDSLKNFLQALGLSVSNYKESKSFKNCYNLFTQSKSLAVAVSNDELVTNDDSIVLKYLNLETYTRLSAKVVQGSGIPYTILSRDIENDEIDNVIRIKINGLLPSFISEASGDAEVSNQYCQYISVYGDQLLVQDINANIVDDQLTVTKFFNTPFKKGSPLICGQKLYGLASVNNFNSIIFDYVQQEKQKPEENTPPAPVFPPIHNKPEAIQAIKDFFEKLHANFNPCKYFDCGVKEDATPCPGDSNDNTSEASENNSSDGAASGEDSSEIVTDSNGDSETGTESVHDSGESEDENVSGSQNESEDENVSENQNASKEENVSGDVESPADGTSEPDSAEHQDESNNDRENPDDNTNSSNGSDQTSADESTNNDVDINDTESNNNNDSSNSEELSSNAEQDAEDVASNSEKDGEDVDFSFEQVTLEITSASGEDAEEAGSNSGQDANVSDTSASEQDQQSNDQSSSGEVGLQGGDSNSNVESEDNRESDSSFSENSPVDNSVSDSAISDSSSDGSS
ncbi:hypothetical protein QE152_g26617 [Popillia japonica]|uniref:Uncharacterized protein n=1 Tax=Popillia japonica TaxID=7064 RepID=A0AAW1JXQ0_POPJA